MVFKKKEEFAHETPHQPFMETPATEASRTVIGKSMVIDGNLSCDEDVFIHGKLKGEIKSKKVVVVEKGGFVEGKIKAHSARVLGKVKGDIEADAKVEIAPSGELLGNIKAPRLAVAEGAVFKGSVDMGGKESESGKWEKPKEQPKQQTKQ